MGKTLNANYLQFDMPHLEFTYRINYKKGEWIVENAAGEYGIGTVLKDIFELEPLFKTFYQNR